MSVSTENFIKSIYLLRSDYELKANSSNLSKQLNISHAAITDMSRKLAIKGLIVYEKYKEITLTPDGEKLALNIIRRHRLWELFLSRVLNIPVTKVHQEAEILEHQTSDFLVDKIDEYLENPSFDPHGDPIPDVEGKFPKNNNISLADGQQGKKYRITRVLQQNDSLIDFLIKNGVHLNTEITIEEKFQDASSMAISLNGKPIILNKEAIACIYVQEIIE
ncbi:MAG: metal-dependent transcriptional regulator [Bacteroidales bacterium]|nr:metal-dependent transcriptional regulator [Bacteroidales bacterium]